MSKPSMESSVYSNPDSLEGDCTGDEKSSSSKAFASDAQQSDTENARNGLNHKKIVDPVKQKEREEKIRISRDKRAEERQRKLDELRESRERASDFRKRQEEERQKKIEDTKRREEEHRATVEERRKKFEEEENERKVAKIKKFLEREAAENKVNGYPSKSYGSRSFYQGSQTSRSVMGGLGSAGQSDGRSSMSRSVSHGGLLKRSPSHNVDMHATSDSASLLSVTRAGRKAASACNLNASKYATRSKSASSPLYRPASTYSDLGGGGGEGSKRPRRRPHSLSGRTPHYCSPTVASQTRTGRDRNRRSPDNGAAVCSRYRSISPEFSSQLQRRSKSADTASSRSRALRGDIKKTIERLSVPRSRTRSKPGSSKSGGAPAAERRSPSPPKRRALDSSQRVDRVRTANPTPPAPKQLIPRSVTKDNNGVMQLVNKTAPTVSAPAKGPLKAMRAHLSSDRERKIQRPSSPPAATRESPSKQSVESSPKHIKEQVQSGEKKEKDQAQQVEYKAKLAEKRRQAREKAERDTQEQQELQEKRLQEEEQKRKREEEEHRLRVEEEMRLAEEARLAEVERLRLAIEAEDKRRKEEEEQQRAEKQAREEAERKALEERQRQEKEAAEKLLKDEEERNERKKKKVPTATLR